MIVSKVIEKLTQAVSENPHTLNMDVEISGNLLKLKEVTEIKEEQSLRNLDEANFTSRQS